MCRLRNIAMGVWQTDGQTDRRTDRQTDRQTDDGPSDPYVSLCFAGDTKTDLSDRLVWLCCIFTTNMSELTVPALTIKPCIIIEDIQQGETSSMRTEFSTKRHKIELPEANSHWWFRGAWNLKSLIICRKWRKFHDANAWAVSVYGRHRN